MGYQGNPLTIKKHTKHTFVICQFKNLKILINARFFAQYRKFSFLPGSPAEKCNSVAQIRPLVLTPVLLQLSDLSLTNMANLDKACFDSITAVDFTCRRREERDTVHGQGPSHMVGCHVAIKA